MSQGRTNADLDLNSIANMQSGNRRAPEPLPPAKPGDIVACIPCNGRGYIHSLHHVVCRTCKGTRVVTIQEYR
jgi:hypothetical protein